MQTLLILFKAIAVELRSERLSCSSRYRDKRKAEAALSQWQEEREAKREEANKAIRAVSLGTILQVHTWDVLRMSSGKWMDENNRESRRGKRVLVADCDNVK